MKKPKSKVPPKLSPQEDRVYKKLIKDRLVPVAELFRVARDTTAKQAARVSPRRRQMHVGVIIQRLNKKRSHTRIEPGDLPSTYAIRRRR